jgi:hypothetical protein
VHRRPIHRSDGAATQGVEERLGATVVGRQRHPVHRALYGALPIDQRGAHIGTADVDAQHHIRRGVLLDGKRAL